MRKTNHHVLKRMVTWLCIMSMLIAGCLTGCGSGAGKDKDQTAAGSEQAPAGSSEAGESGSTEAAGGDQAGAQSFQYTEESDGSLTLTSWQGSDSTLIIPSEIDGKSVKAIGDSCFQGLVCLKKVSVPEGVTAIGNYAFECCSALEKIYLPESLESIGDGAFSGCASLYLADMQDGLKSIGKGAFLFCTSLIDLQLPEQLQEMGAFAFSNCSSLVQVIFRGGNINALPDRAFYNCESMNRIVFPESVTSIGKRTFAGCEKWAYPYFPGEITSVGEYAFEGCSALSYKPVEGDFVPESAYEACYNLETEGDESEEGGSGEEEEYYDPLDGYEPEEPVEEDNTVPDQVGSIAGDKNLFNPDQYADYKVISNDDFSAWSESYLEFCRQENLPDSSDLIPYIMLYKGEVVQHYVAMTAILNQDPAMMEEAAALFGDDFEETYQMINHGLITELSRGRMCDNLVLYSGVYDSQLMAAAGTDQVPTMEQLKDAIGNEFTDPPMISTTTDPGIAANFGSTLFVIYASKEAMDSLGVVSIDSYIGSVEKEILMNAGATYKILDVGTMPITVLDDEEKETTIYRNYITLELLKK